MAMHVNPPRLGESGFSLIEALVTVALTSILVLVLLPLSSHAPARSLAIAAQSVGLSDRLRVDRVFRDALESADPESLLGGSTALTVDAAALFETPCQRPGVSRLLSLKVVNRENGGELVCQSGGRQVPLLGWKGGRATFSYSSDGREWTSTWSPSPRRAGSERLPALSPIVRLDVQTGGPDSFAWMAHVGAIAPVAIESIVPGDGERTP